MDRPRRRPEPVAIDITWVSCRGVRSSLPFHTPCLYASIFVVSTSSAKNAHGGHRRHHRVKTPTDRTGGENPEWDAPLRLYLPDVSPTPAPEPEVADGKNKKKDGGDDANDDVLLLKFELKAEVAVLGDVHTASAAVPVPDLVADGRTRRVSYQLVGPDGRQPNGVLSFSYAIHERANDDGQSSDDSEPATPPCCHTPAASAAAVAVPLPTVTAAPRLYPEIEWTLTTEQPHVFPLVTAKPFAVVVDTQYYPPPAAPPPPAPPIEAPSVYPPAPPVEATSVYPPAPPVEATSVYPPAPPIEASSVCPPVLDQTSFRSVHSTVVEKASALYPTLDLAPVSYYPPAPAYGVECGYAAAPVWGDRCLYG